MRWLCGFGVCVSVSCVEVKNQFSKWSCCSVLCFALYHWQGDMHDILELLEGHSPNPT